MPVSVRAHRSLRLVLVVLILAGLVVSVVVTRVLKDECIETIDGRSGGLWFYELELRSRLPGGERVSWLASALFQEQGGSLECLWVGRQEKANGGYSSRWCYGADGTRREQYFPYSNNPTPLEETSLWLRRSLEKDEILRLVTDARRAITEVRATGRSPTTRRKWFGYTHWFE